MEFFLIVSIMIQHTLLSLVTNFFLQAARLFTLFAVDQFVGFGVFKVNYTGSTGTRFDTTRNLNGKISIIDVPQVHKLVNELIQANSNIDVKSIFLNGGSFQYFSNQQHF